MGSIILKNNATSGIKPSSLSRGELAINTVDGTLFFGDGKTVRILAISGSSGGGGGGGGTVTSVQLANGTGISLSGTNPITTTGTITITNTAPDQTVTLTNGGGISITGTYPNFTLAVTSTVPFPYTGSAIISGSLQITGSLNAPSITGSLQGTASWADNATTAANISGGQDRYVALWSGSTQLTSSVMYQSGSNIGLGTIVPAYRFQVSGSTASGSVNLNSVLYVSSSRVGINVTRPTASFNVGGTTVLSSSYEETTLTLYGSASATVPLLDVTASNGRLLTAYDSMTGSLFEVNTAGGVPVLEVNSDNTVKIGIWPSQGIYTSYKTVVLSGSAVTIYTLPTASANSAYFDYTVVSGSNMRAGTFVANWYSPTSTINYIETSTDDIGNTSDFTMSADISTSNFRLLGQSAVSNWEVRTIIRYI